MGVFIMKQQNKPIIETAINGAALMLIAFGAVEITNGANSGYLMVIFGIALEWFKYWGRRKYW